MSAVTFDGVTKKFGGVTAVDDFSLQIADGEFMVLLGPSGCGKSTALRMIAGLEEISAGILTIGERVINHIPPRDRDIAMVFQSYALYPHMTVAKNIESPLVANKNAKVDAEERPRRVAEAAETLDLTDVPRPQARRALRRPAPAGRPGPRHRAPARGLPHGRAAVQPGRQAAHADPARAGRPAPSAGHHDRLRDPRPGRGHDHGRPHRGHQRRPTATGRSVPGGLRAPREPVRGQLHRQPADEHHRRHALARQRPRPGAHRRGRRRGGRPWRRGRRSPGRRRHPSRAPGAHTPERHGAARARWRTSNCSATSATSCARSADRS